MPKRSASASASSGVIAPDWTCWISCKRTGSLDLLEVVCFRVVPADVSRLRMRFAINHRHNRQAGGRGAHRGCDATARQPFPHAPSHVSKIPIAGRAASPRTIVRVALWRLSDAGHRALGVSWSAPAVRRIGSTARTRRARRCGGRRRRTGAGSGGGERRRQEQDHAEGQRHVLSSLGRPIALRRRGNRPVP